MMALSASQMVAAAKGRTERLTPDQLVAALRDGTVTVIDIREEEERVRDGYLAGSHHAPRGMLEFYADPTSPWHRLEFDPGNRVVLACDTGARSALAAETLQRMGYRHAFYLDGGLHAWVAQGLPVERTRP